MTDLQLLEAAAKAAGYMAPGSTWVGPWELAIEGRYWHPLRDDGDALRLAGFCSIDVVFDPAMKRTEAHYLPARAPGRVPDDRDWLFEPWGLEKAAATRRAIVRAAAAIALTAAGRVEQRSTESTGTPRAAPQGGAPS